MSAVSASRRFTLDDYWAIEHQSPVRHEYLHGSIYAMAGGKPRHNEVASNLHAALWNALRDTPCRPMGSDQRIRVSPEEYTYPDLSVFCGRLEVALGPPPDTATNPVVVVEVLSDSTRGYDSTEKLDMYRRIPSVRTILLVEPETVRVTCWTQTAAGWTSQDHTRLDGIVPVLDTAIEMAAVYARAVT